MNRWAFIIIILLLGSTSYAQKRGSREMGGGVSFWSISGKDTSESNLNINGLWAYYFTRDFMFEVEPYLSLRFATEDIDLTGLLMGGLSKRIIDVSNIDRRTSSGWSRKNERTTAGVYGSVSGGIWAERSENFEDPKIYAGPAIAVGIGTHSNLGSLTKIRTKFQFVYLMPAPPLHEEPRTMFTITVGFGVITKL